MTEDNIKKVWQRYYETVPEQLQKVKSIKKVATAFNTNIDAVVKISGKKLSELAENVGLSLANMHEGENKILNGKDAVRGIVKCFISGVGEEWLCNGVPAFDWLKDNIGYNRLQMGGQGGIVANAMAVLGVQNVYVHTASHPKLQAEQFLDFDNLLTTDDDGNLCKAREINRRFDIPLIHWIIEFDGGDKLKIADKEFICPKSNRFIATYDPDNQVLKKNDAFLHSLDITGFDYMILSGYHNLVDYDSGMERVKETIPLIQKWKADNPHSFLHLELASTQDVKVRKAIIEYIAPLVDSVGLNDKEAMDVLEAVDCGLYEKVKDVSLDAPRLFEILLKIKEICHTPRIQLHFLGMYLTLQDKDFRITPSQNKQGMMLAATIAATKAGTGNIDNDKVLLWAHGREVADVGLAELKKLSVYLECPELYENGICNVEKYEVIAVPTILVEKPLTLVGMGDTISSISLVGAL